MKDVHWTCGGGVAFPGEGRNRLRMGGRTGDGAIVVADCTEKPTGWEIGLSVDGKPVGNLATAQPCLGDALGEAVRELLVAA